MSESDTDRIERLFDEALEQPADRREDWLRSQCEADHELFNEVRSLLEAHDRASGFLGRSALEQAPALAGAADPIINTRIGPYRVIERIGTGGMGSVYLAERDDQTFDRRVAIKLIRRGLDTDEILERFDRERRVLANLDHPNIAKLIDGGSLPDGSPYFIMEHVEGKRLDEFCDENRLTVPQRIDLFRTVCDAVAHAHRNLIIHRDLKPANILVTPDGTVKLLDFGVAKVLQQTGDTSHDATLTVERRLTPAYASPEQVRGDAVTTATDVYSLGVILYELLTGCRPYRVRSDSWRDLERAICDDDPTRPSVAVVSPATEDNSTLTTGELSHLRSVDPARLRSLLSGDVEWVVLMALRKEPDRRYATVQQLADDLRRLRDSLPVLARPDTLAYRASRFVQRNRAGVLAASVLVAALVGATAVSINFALGEAEARASEAEQRQAAETERDRAIEAERVAEQRARELEQVAAFQADQFEGIDINRMGQRILSQILASARLDAELAGIDDDTATEFQQELNSALDGINFANVARDALDEAVFGPALDSIEARFADQPRVRAALLESVAEAMSSVGMIEQALAHFETALVLRRSHDGDRAIETLNTLARLGNLRTQLGDADGAEADYTEALAGYEAVLGESSRQAISARNSLGAAAQARGDIARARDLYREALGSAREHLGNDNPTTISIMNNLAFLSLDAGELAEAEPYFEEALDRTRELYGSSALATARRTHAMGVFRSSQGRYNEALGLLTEGFEGMRAALGDAHPDVITAMIDIARALFDLGRFDEADAYASTAYELSLGIADNHRYIQRALNTRGRVAMARRDYAAAESHVREEIERLISQFGSDHARVGTAQGNLALILFRAGRVAESETLLRDAYASQVAIRGADHPMTLSLLNNLAGVVRARGKLAEAQRYWQDAYEGRKKALGDGHPHTMQTLRHLIKLAADRERPTDRYRLLVTLVDADSSARGVNRARSPFAAELAEAAYEAGEFEHALELALEIRRAKPPLSVQDAERIRFLDADALVALGRFEDAEQVYMRLANLLHNSENAPDRDHRQLAQRIEAMYRAWHEASGLPDHLEKADAWQARAETPPADR